MTLAMTSTSNLTMMGFLAKEDCSQLRFPASLFGVRSRTHSEKYFKSYSPDPKSLMDKI
jgi:hypothetical protein